jgi:hypothetical protein
VLLGEPEGKFHAVPSQYCQGLLEVALQEHQCYSEHLQGKLEDASAEDRTIRYSTGRSGQSTHIFPSPQSRDRDLSLVHKSKHIGILNK